jgi:hypothetical protein
MAINFLNTVNLNKNQLNNAAIQNLAADPGGAVEGQIYFNTVDFDLKIFANGAWKEVGATSGVETLSTTQAGNSTGNTLTVLTNAVGDVTINSFAYAGGSNIGYVPSSGTATTFLRGDGAWIVPTDTGITSVVNVTGTSGGTPLDNAIVNRVLTLTSNEYAGGTNIGYVPTGGAVNQYLDGTGAWVDVTTGDIESVTESIVNNRLGIRITTPTGPDPVVGLDIIGQTNLGTTPATDDELIIYDTSTTTNKSITVENLVGGYETTYTIDVPAGTANINLKGTDGAGTVTNDAITLSGFTSQTVTNHITTSNIQVALTPSVVIANDLSLTSGRFKQLAGGTNEFAGPIDLGTSGVNQKLLRVADGAAATDGVNLGQVEALVAGIGLFKGGYNATTGLTTDLGAANGSLDGASNIALDQGDFFVVTTGGGAFYTQTLEVGDMIFANTGIAANSTPPITDYTVVIADANIAGAGATDGGTQKGVAGFDSANFTASATGWVQLKEEVLSGRMRKVSLTSGNNTVAGETTFTVNLATTFGSNPTPVAADTIATVKETTSSLIVYPEVTGNGTGSLDFVFMPQVTDGDYTAIISIV